MGHASADFVQLFLLQGHTYLLGTPVKNVAQLHNSGVPAAPYWLLVCAFPEDSSQS